MEPPDVPDPDGVPVAIDGLRSLVDHIKAFKDHHKGIDTKQLLTEMHALLKANETYQKKIMEAEPSAKDHDEWKEDAAAHIENIRAEVKRLMGIENGA
jgi:hypothetical protein